jgi:hypothetical protein
MIDRARFGIVGDGRADDAAALEHAIAEAGGPVVLPAGDYRLGRTVEWRMAEVGRCGLSGGGAARLIMAGAGPALRLVGTHRGTANPASVSEATRDRERFPLVDGLEIVGDHPEACGIELRGCFKPILTRLFIHQCRHGLHLVERNRDVLIHGCQIYHNRGVGIFLEGVNLHQTNIHDNHLSYNRGGAIRVAGSEVRNLQIVGNDIEYNTDPEQPDVADILLDARGASIREGSIVGNQVQAVRGPGGANIRLLGDSDERRHKIGHLTITGNQLSNQDVNLDIRHAQGIAISGNSFFGGWERSIRVMGSDYVTIGANVIDRNPDYHRQLPDIADGILLEDCSGCAITGLVLSRLRGPGARGGVIEVRRSREVTISACQVVEAGGTPLVLEAVRNGIVQGCILRRGAAEDAAAGERRALRVAGACANVLIAHCLVEGEIEGPEQGMTVEAIQRLG